MKNGLHQFDYTAEYFMNVKYHNIIMQTIVNR